MSAKYYVTLTNYGAELVAEAHDLKSITLTEMVIGDANGIPYQPIDHTDLTELVHQTAAIEIREVKIENNIATVSAIIPANVGGFNIHELGLKDASGKLVYIGNYHGAYKPVIAEGGGGELELVIDIKATAGAQALIEINPLIISASKEWVLQRFDELMKAIKNKEDIKIGDLYITTLNFIDSTEVAAHKNYGTWEKFGDGHALVSLASTENNLAPAWMKTIGNKAGEYEHKLTIQEMPKHKHGISGGGGDEGSLNYPDSSAELNVNTTYTDETGGDQPHNNIQPSIIIAIWKRTS